MAPLALVDVYSVVLEAAWSVELLNHEPNEPALALGCFAGSVGNGSILHDVALELLDKATS